MTFLSLKSEFWRQIDIIAIDGDDKRTADQGFESEL